MYTSYPSVFADFFADFDSLVSSPRFSYSEIFPPQNIYFSKEGDATLQFALAGYSKDELSVELDGNKITIEANPKTSDVVEENTYYYRQKIKKAEFKRVYSLPGDSYDFDNSKVTYVDGLLTITIPHMTVKKTSKYLSIEG